MRTQPHSQPQWTSHARTAAVAVFATLVVLACAQPDVQPETAPPAAPAPPPRTTPPPAPAPEAKSAAANVLKGRVSMYGKEFAGRPTASGETFDPEGLTMAHRTLPFGTRVRVTNLENRRSVEVVVNDRGPAIAGRIADLSLGAARRIGMLDDGVVEATLEVLAPTTAR
jgi:rare lipoprotein A